MSTSKTNTTTSIISFNGTDKPPQKVSNFLLKCGQFAFVPSKLGGHLMTLLSKNSRPGVRAAAAIIAEFQLHADLYGHEDRDDLETFHVDLYNHKDVVCLVDQLLVSVRTGRPFWAKLTFKCSRIL